jgi:hypothetical protein
LTNYVEFRWYVNYQRRLVAIKHTLQLPAEIDKTIPDRPRP